VALDQKYIDNEVFKKVSDKALDISRMISGFIKYLQSSPLKGNKYKSE